VVFVADKVALGLVASSNSISPVSLSTDCSTLITIHHLGLVQ
jgi:hypothetical protein